MAGHSFVNDICCSWLAAIVLHVPACMACSRASMLGQEG